LNFALLKAHTACLWDSGLSKVLQQVSPKLRQLADMVGLQVLAGEATGFLPYAIVL
jgi:hypothetical protein